MPIALNAASYLFFIFGLGTTLGDAQGLLFAVHRGLCWIPGIEPGKSCQGKSPTHSIIALGPALL